MGEDVLLSHLKIYSYAALFFGAALGFSSLSKLYILKISDALRLTLIGLLTLAGIWFSWAYFIFFDSGEFIYAPIFCDAFYDYEYSFPPERQANPYNLKEFIAPSGECYLSGLFTIAIWIFLVVALSFLIVAHIYGLFKNKTKNQDNDFTDTQSKDEAAQIIQCEQAVDEIDHLPEANPSKDHLSESSDIDENQDTTPILETVDQQQSQYIPFSDTGKQILDIIYDEIGFSSKINDECKQSSRNITHIKSIVFKEFFVDQLNDYLKSKSVFERFENGFSKVIPDEMNPKIEFESYKQYRYKSKPIPYDKFIMILNWSAYCLNRNSDEFIESFIFYMKEASQKVTSRSDRIEVSECLARIESNINQKTQQSIPK